MALTRTEIVGFAKNVIELVKQARDVLRKAGIDPDEVLAILTKQFERAVNAEARQERLKRQSREATIEVEASMDELYRGSSGYLDVLIAAAGKGSLVAKNYRRTRSRIRSPKRDDGEGEG